MLTEQLRQEIEKDIKNIKIEEIPKDKKILILKSGYGGFGNEHFKSSTNTTPKEWRPGEEGEKMDFITSHVLAEFFSSF